ncbi:hypothetical protein NG895_14720 [Aeoliella sp. ICT_H6.2]|uniref:Restriction endonuclease n=1 Tax=Aeoliella straminimaris TaxID=2954799 RepID=A0A9X2JH69_9BACT|nr:hypothetical protein [Aeoliella straminimaris]MCO6045162.1 hypothetical protein [Aeoliella straminimaris]
MASSSTDSSTEPLLFRLPKSARDGELPRELPLELVVRDREVIEALLEQEELGTRNTFALDALRIGVMALRHANTRLDADLLRRETSQLLGTLSQTLEHYSKNTGEQLNRTLKEYFDPSDGRFNERVGRLVSQDGELAKLMRDQIDGENSNLARTMLTHVGRESPLMKMLDPAQSEGLLAALRQAVEGQLTQQSEKVLKEFSLDNREGALARLVAELNTKHGDLTKDLKEKIDEVVKEFSLDDDGSALSRLVQNVDRAQKTITSEFSLDNNTSALSRLKEMLEATQGAIHKNLTLDEDGSPLYRLKKELHELLAEADKKNVEFQQQVKVALAEITTARKEAERSTRHGEVFEDAVYEFVAREAQHAGDIVTPTGATTGLIKNCKKGDCVVELGPSCVAAGERIVVEAKQHGGYTLASAREELEIARKNRDAGIGLFVFSRRLAPTGIETFQHFGSDIVCVWDPEDPSTDLWLRAAMVTARAISVRQAGSTESQKVDFETIDRAVLEIEKRAANLDSIRTTAKTIISGGERIIKRVDTDEKSFEKQIALLREKLSDVKTALGCEEGSVE